ncbi:M12 family metallo-peptidase [Sinomonas albida]|uniref:M12 family metallo-peptidase n=1 Tax=Sinomonas albida TaxID=369942 RepID=UPI00301B2E62
MFDRARDNGGGAGAPRLRSAWRAAASFAVALVAVVAPPATSALAAPGVVVPAAAPAAVQPALSYPQRTAQIGITLVTLKTRDQPNATYDTTALQNAFNTANTYWQTMSAGHISLHLDSLSSLSTNQVASNDEFSTIINAVTTQLNWTDAPNKVLMLVDPNQNVTVNGSPTALGVTWSIGNESGRVMLAQPSQFTPPVMTHELGHIQGLGHANTLECTDGRPDSKIVNGAFADASCRSKEYGNNTDVMGISQYNEPYLDSVLYQFGGYGNGNEIADVGTAGQPATYTLTPWAGTGANRAVKFQDPVTGEEYYLQYKAPVGYDAPTAVNGNQGVQIIKTSIDPTESVLIPPNTLPDSSYYRYNLSWQAGQTFTTDGGTQVQITAVNANSATVQLTAMGAVLGPQMDAKAAQWGLGSATGPVTAVRNGGYYRNYQNGAVISTPANGLMVSRGAIRSVWGGLGYENGPLGYPTTDEVSGLRNSGVYQNYEGGAIVFTPSTGAHSSMGVIRQRWQQLGFETGVLGYPTTETIGGLRNGGSYQNYENGAIIAAPSGAYESYGSIRQVWQQFGFEAGALGYPTSYVTSGLVNGGSYQNYEGGAIVSAPAAGTHESMGPIRQTWLQLGSEAGALGYPASGIVGGLRNGGSYQSYQNGAIVSSPNAGTHESLGAMRQVWQQLGFESGVLGYPTSGIVAGLVNGGSYQNYEGGATITSPATGAHESYGPIRALWQKLGFEAGELGYPTSGIVGGLRNGGSYQNFQNGAIVSSPTAGTHESLGAMRQVWQKLGFETGVLGYPTTGIVTGLKNGGSYQNYEGGATITSPATGAHESYGPIRTAWSSTGFEAGRLGYPTSGIYSIPGGTEQDFQGGHITLVNGTTTIIYS